MTPTFPASHALPRGVREAGFSLLEMLVVLAIVGTLLSLVSVNLSASVEQASFLRDSRIAASKVQPFRAEAVLARRNLLIVTSDTQLAQWPGYPRDAHRQFPLPEGYRVSGPPVEIMATGFCRGGPLVFSNAIGRRYVVELTAPHCAVREDAVGDKPD